MLTVPDARAEAQRRCRASLDGLAAGDTFGETFFGPAKSVVLRIREREIAPAPWRYTDDTEMAISIVEQLLQRDAIDQDDLARRFAQRMDPMRGYGQAAYEILSSIRAGGSWRSSSGGAFRGRGSFGNGAAMRVAPVGAYFALDLERTAREASLSAEITHSHPEGIAGAVAVAVAAALAATEFATGPVDPARFLQAVRDHVAPGYVRDGIVEALGLPRDFGPIEAAKRLGNGSGVTAPDTVPFCLWVVARHLEGSFEVALWETVSALGDRDTTCAIVGGILVLRHGVSTIPGPWLRAREPLPIAP